MSNDTDAEQLAQAFHETYERLAPAFGYETRKESAVPWADVPEQNKRLMVAVADCILTEFLPGYTERVAATIPHQMSLWLRAPVNPRRPRRRSRVDGWMRAVDTLLGSGRLSRFRFYQ
jgi:hypothetical protein